MLQSAMYPNGQKPPLLSRTLLDHYGEQAARHYIVAFRASDEGQRGPLAIPERFSERRGVRLPQQLDPLVQALAGGDGLGEETGRADLEYFSSPEAARWRPLLDALDATYRAWMEPQIQAIRAAIPRRRSRSATTIR